jgi:uncharacterized membrane protein
MKGRIVLPILITIIAIGSLRTEEKRAELLAGDFLLWLIVVATVVGWVGAFWNRENKQE